MADQEVQAEEIASDDADVEIEDEDLYQNLSEFVESVLNILDDFSEITASDRPPHMSSSSYAASSKGSSQSLSQSDVEALVNKIGESWDNYPGYTQCRSSFDMCDIYDKEIGYAINMDILENPEQWEKLLKTDTLPKFLTRYLLKNRETTYNGSTFADVYSSLRIISLPTQ